MADRDFDFAFLPSDPAVGLRHQPGRRLDARPAAAAERYRHPEDAAEQLKRGLDLHEKVFGMRPQECGRQKAASRKKRLAIAHEPGREVDGDR